MTSPNKNNTQISDLSHLTIKFKNCYGIKKLYTTLNFFNCNIVAIYASNGMMKTSFAKTFKSLSDGDEPQDELYEEIKPKHTLKDSEGIDIIPTNIFVIESEIKLDTSKKIPAIISKSGTSKKI